MRTYFNNFWFDRQLLLWPDPRLLREVGDVKLSNTVDRQALLLPKEAEDYLLWQGEALRT